MPRTPYRTPVEDLIITSGDTVRGEDPSSGAGGDLPLRGGNAAAASAMDGGDVLVTGGAADGVGIGGSITLTPGTGGTAGSLVLDYATWPAADGGAGQVLSTNGAGVLSWIAAGGASSLQAAYVGGNTITTNATDGPFDVSGTQAISLDASTASNFTVDSSNLTLSTTTSGDVFIVSAASVLADGATGVELNSSGGALQIGNDANTGAINVGTGAAARTITIGNATGATAVNVNAGSGEINLNTNTTVTGKLTVTGLIDPTGLVLDEQGVRPFDPTGLNQGLIWVSAGAPNTLFFTDDAGTDWLLNSGASTWSAVLAAGNTSGGTDAVISSGDSVTGVDSAVGAGTGFTVRGGDYTGAGAGAGNSGGSLIIIGGETNGTTNGIRGGDVTVQGGAITGAAGGTTRGGDVFITGGAAAGAGAADGGHVMITGGTSASDIPGNVTIQGGGGQADAGSVSIIGGATAGGSTADDGGSVNITAGTTSASTVHNTGNINITVPQVTNTDNVQGGDITVQAGNTGSRNATGGDVLISAGDSNGGGATRAGDVVITAGDQTNAVSGGDGGDIILNPGTSANAVAGEVTINGKLTVTGGIDPTYLGLNEQATKPITAAGGIGYLWVDNSTPTRLIYTDDADTDFTIAGSGVGTSLQTAYAFGNTITTNATDGAFDVSGTQAISLDSSSASNFTVDTGGLTLSTTTSGTLLVDAAALLDVNAAANIDVDVTGTFDMLSTGAFSIDGTGASNVSADAGTLTLSTTSSGDVAISSAADVTVTPASGQTTSISGTRTSVNRVQHDQGTTLVAGDFALSAGWGTTAAVASITGTDSRFLLEWTSTGTGQAANPTITLTFSDGAWPNSPFPIFVDNGSVDGGGGYFAPQFELTSISTTAAVWTLRAAAANGSSTAYTPGAADTWKAICHIMG